MAARTGYKSGELESGTKISMASYDDDRAYIELESNELVTVLWMTPAELEAIGEMIAELLENE